MDYSKILNIIFYDVFNIYNPINYIKINHKY